MPLLMRQPTPPSFRAAREERERENKRQALSSLRARGQRSAEICDFTIMAVGVMGIWPLGWSVLSVGLHRLDLDVLCQSRKLVQIKSFGVA